MIYCLCHEIRYLLKYLMDPVKRMLIASPSQRNILIALVTCSIENETMCVSWDKKSFVILHPSSFLLGCNYVQSENRVVKPN